MNGILKIITLITVLVVGAIAAPVGQVYAQQKYFFTLHLVAYPGWSSDAMQAIDVLSYEAAKVGINIQVDMMDTATYVKKVTTGDFDLRPPGGSPIWSDPSGFVTWGLSKYIPPGGLNVKWLDSGLFDTVLNQLSTEMNMTKQQTLAWQILKMIQDNMYNLPLYYTSKFIARSQNLQNVAKEPFYNGFLRYAGYWTWTGKTAGDNTTVKMGCNFSPQGTYSPFFSIYAGNADLFSLCIEGLVQFNHTSNAWEGGLAKSWDVSSDYLNWTFHLRDNAYWSDGVQFTADDVKFTYDAAANPAVGCVWASKTSYIKSVDVVDNYTVTFQMAQRYSAAMSDIFALSWPTLGLAPKHIFDGVNATDYRTHWSNTQSVIGTGPYKFVQYVKDSYLEWVRNDQWWGGVPQISHFFEVIIPNLVTAKTSLATGAVDILDPMLYGYTQSDIDDLRANPQLVVTNVFDGGLTNIEWNNGSPIMQNKWVRWALAYCFPREHFCQDVVGLGTTPASQFASPVQWWYNPNLTQIPYNLTAAKECLMKAGYNYDLLETAAGSGTDAMTLYGIPVATLVVGLVVGGVTVYYINRRRPISQKV